MAAPGVLKLVCAVVMCAAVVAPWAEAAMSCGDVTQRLAPCLTYLQNGGAVQPTCCGGIKTLLSAAKATVDRQTACKCMKSTAMNIPSIKLNFAAQLPGKCGVNIPYAISPSTDCSKVK
ncbi:non-specific lipid-transfer protein 1-like [Malania oleifera]|uniref:non-specific lipid-transfer protein 1-like n=1 Tax=Malania oleifera TaxID=397392 RepID=UPI0025AE1845|nr:non-specific lipid-transfer protein 1-like [Malania oleifera]